LRQIRAVRVAETAVDTQQYHGPHDWITAEVIDDAPQFDCFEHARPVLGSLFPQNGFRWLLENGAESHRPVDEACVVCVFENRPHIAHVVPHRDRAATLCQLCAKLVEVVGGKIGCRPLTSECCDNFRTNSVIAREHSRGILVRVHQSLFAGQKPIAKFANRQPIEVGARGLASVQVVFLFQILLQCGIGIGPRAEVVGLPANLLCPPLRRVREEGKVRIWFLWLVLAR